MPKTFPSGLLPQLYKLYTKPLTLVEVFLNEPYTSPSHRYCGNNKDITFAGNLYTAIAAKRGSIKSEESTVLQDLEVSLDNIDLEFKQLIAGGMFKNKRTRILLVFDGFLSSYDNKIILFDGFIDSVSGDDRFINMSIGMKFPFDKEYPKRIFQIGCNWTFCDDYCTLDLIDYQEEIIVKANSTESTIFFDDNSKEENYFFPGNAKILDGNLAGEIKPIVVSNNVSVTLRIPFSEIPEVGTTILLQKLCGKSPASCKDIFNNYEINFGGFPHVPRMPRL